MRNKFIAALAGLALAVLGSVTPAQAGEGVWSVPAAMALPPGHAIDLQTGKVEQAAAAALASCTAGYICFYNNSDGTALLLSVSASSRAKSICYAMPTSATNRTSYIVNNYGGYWYVFDGGSCQTTPGTIYPVSQGRMGAAFNDNISSYYRAT